MKKGQVSLFVILGIVLLLVVGFFLFVKKEISASPEDELVTDQQFNSEVNLAMSYLESCVDSRIQKSLDNAFMEIRYDVAIYDGQVSVNIGGLNTGMHESFTQFLEDLERKMNIIIENSPCVKEVPEEFYMLKLEPEETEVRFEAEDIFNIRTELEGQMEGLNIFHEVQPMQKNYGMVFREDFDRAITGVILSFLMCDGDICFNQDIDYSYFDMEVVINYISDGQYLVTITKEGAKVNDKPFTINLDVQK